MMTEEKRQERREAARKKEETISAMRSRIEADYLPAGLSQNAQDKLWELAWEHGHSYGESEVSLHYQDFASLAVVILEG